MAQLSLGEYHEVSPAVTNTGAIQGIEKYESEEKAKINTEGSNRPVKVSYFLSFIFIC